MKFTRETARAYGSKGGKVSAARQREIRTELSRPLKTRGDALRRIEAWQRWGALNWVAGVHHNAGVRGVEVWLRNHRDELERELQATMDELEETRAKLRDCMKGHEAF